MSPRPSWDRGLTTTSAASAWTRHRQAARLERGDHGGIGARRQDIVVALGKPPDDGQDLRGSLALAEHGLGDAVAE